VPRFGFVEAGPSLPVAFQGIQVRMNTGGLFAIRMLDLGALLDEKVDETAVRKLGGKLQRSRTTELGLGDQVSWGERGLAIYLFNSSRVRRSSIRGLYRLDRTT